MKSKISLTLAAVVMSIASMAAATSSLVVTSSKENVFQVQYQSSKVGMVKVFILNSKNELVFTEALANTGSFIRPYNFSELAEGEYTIVVEGNGVKQAEKVNYASAKVMSFVMVSEVENAKNKYVLNVTNNGTQYVTVRVVSADGTTLHEQTIEVTGKAAVVYDLNKVKTNDETITFEVIAGTNQVQTIRL